MATVGRSFIKQNIFNKCYEEAKYPYNREMKYCSLLLILFLNISTVQGADYYRQAQIHIEQLAQTREFSDLFAVNPPVPPPPVAKVRATINNQDIIEEILDLILSSAYAKCSNEYARDRALLRSKLQQEEDIKLMVSMMVGYAITLIDNEAISLAWSMFQLAQSATQDDKSGFFISIIAMAAPFMWNPGPPAWGELISLPTTRMVLGLTLGFMNIYVAVKCQENAEKARQRAQVFQQLKDELEAKMRETPGAELVPCGKTSFWQQVLQQIFPTANAKELAAGMMGQGCLNAHMQLEADCQCRKTNSCYAIDGISNRKTNIPPLVAKSVDYLTSQLNLLNAGLIKLSDLDLAKIRQHQAFLKKSGEILLDEANRERRKKNLPPIQIDLSEQGVKKFFNQRILASLPPGTVDRWNQKQLIATTPPATYRSSFAQAQAQLTRQANRSLNHQDTWSWIDQPTLPADQEAEAKKELWGNIEFINLGINKNKDLSLFAIIGHRYRLMYASGSWGNPP